MWSYMYLFNISGVICAPAIRISVKTMHNKHLVSTVCYHMTDFKINTLLIMHQNSALVIIIERFLVLVHKDI